MKVATSAAVFAALFSTAMAAKEERTFAVLRFNNKQLTKGRMDPIVSPNKVSNHVHSVMGGSGFGPGSTGKDLQNSKCSNAMVKGDNSNYWYPSLYFQDPNTGEFEDVEVFYTNAYYFFEPTNDDIKAFPVGLSMVSGNAKTRVAPEGGAETNLDPSAGPINAVKWTCPRLDNNYEPPSWPEGSDGSTAGIGDPVNKGEGVGFPDVDCDGYASPLRADIHFPSCYNPDAGLTNFAENMAWPEDNNGKQDCPKGYTHVPHLFIEVYWNTPVFADRWDQNSGKQPFVLSNGDVTGFSSHADFMAGWDEDLLQHIIDTCDAGTLGMDTCPGLTYGLNEDDCTIDSAVDELVDGALASLPGDLALRGWGLGSGDGGSGGGGSSVPAPPLDTSPASTQPAGQTPTGSDSADETSEYAPHQETGPTTTTATIPAVGNNELPAGPTSTPIPDPPVEPSSESSPPKTTKVLDKPKATSCKPEIKTVWETVTVTADDPSAPTDAAANDTDTVSGFKYAGCFKDASDHVLSGELRANLGDVSNEKCVTHCQEAGFALAGTENGGECYCGNELVGSEKINDSECDAQCTGDGSGTCGGSWALSVYSADGEASIKSAKPRRHVHDHFLRHRGSRH